MFSSVPVISSQFMHIFGFVKVSYCMTSYSSIFSCFADSNTVLKGQFSLFQQLRLNVRVTYA